MSGLHGGATSRTVIDASLSVLPAGVLLPNPREPLGCPAFTEALASLGKEHGHDIIPRPEAFRSGIENDRSKFENTMDVVTATLFGKARQVVLVQLFQKTDSPLYQREMSRLMGISPGALQHELNQLLKADLILREEDGNRVAYWTNTAHPIFGERNVGAECCCRRNKANAPATASPVATAPPARRRHRRRDRPSRH
ncbi:hypothetical protein [Accumulibacter sp.]|uniref:helix-turn-helix domain-containing protein n=1 Tax=Accumulibacter sp. TaxID=2053492 RepID=UPI0035ADBAD2